MTTVVTTDIHLSANSRDAYRIKWCEGLPALLEKENADQLIILGDLTAEKDYHSAWLTNKIVLLIRDAAKVCPVYILQGNHDYTKADTPFFGFVGRFKWIYWIKKITAVEDMEGLGRCLFIPHQRKLDAWQNMPQLKEEWDWVFTHATFEGSKSESGEELTGAPIGAVLGHRVISGDVHVPQKLGPVTYVGPPYRINFGDRYQPRILLLTEHSVNQRLCEGPRKVLLEVDGWKMLEGAADDGLAKAGDIVKVRYEIAAPDYDKWPSIRRKIEQWAAGIGVELDSALPVPRVEDSPDSKRRTVVSSKAQSSSSRVMDDEAVMEAYCERCRVGEKTLNLGLRLMEKAPG